MGAQLVRIPTTCCRFGKAPASSFRFGSTLAPRCFGVARSVLGSYQYWREAPFYEFEKALYEDVFKSASACHGDFFLVANEQCR